MEQGPVGHDELEFNPGDPARGAGDALDQGVSHDLPPGRDTPGPDSTAGARARATAGARARATAGAGARATAGPCVPTAGTG